MPLGKKRSQSHRTANAVSFIAMQTLKYLITLNYISSNVLIRTVPTQLRRCHREYLRKPAWRRHLDHYRHRAAPFQKKKCDWKSNLISVPTLSTTAAAATTARHAREQGRRRDSDNRWTTREETTKNKKQKRQRQQHRQGQQNAPGRRGPPYTTTVPAAIRPATRPTVPSRCHYMFINDRKTSYTEKRSTYPIDTGSGWSRNLTTNLN